MIGTQFQLECEVRDVCQWMWCEFTVEVTHFDHHPPHRGSPHTCDSSDDYYGYTDIDWKFVDWCVTDQDGGEVACGLGEPEYFIDMSLQDIKEAILEQIDEAIEQEGMREDY
jgi:hypothetical protein